MEAQDRANDDVLFREELISHGLPVDAFGPQPDDDARAAVELARIVRVPKRRRLRAPRWGGFRLPAAPTPAAWGGRLALVATAAFLLVLQPGIKADVAQAETPPVLRISGAEPGSLPKQGAPAGLWLTELAEKARALPYAWDNPVHRVVRDSWLTESGVDESGNVVGSILHVVRTETYFLPDDTFRLIERWGEPLRNDGQIDVTAGGPGLPALVDESYLRNDPGHNFIETLPTDPVELRSTLLEGGDPDLIAKAAGGMLFSEITGFASSFALPPELVAAFWEMLAEEPSVTQLGIGHDRIGRPALVLSTIGTRGFTQELLLIDPTTGAFLGDESVLIEPAEMYTYDPPAVLELNTIIESDRVPIDSVPAVP